MGLPQADESAYDGNTIVRSVTYGKSKKGRTTGVGKVRQAIASLESAAEKRLTLDSIDRDSKISFENQVIINQEVAEALLKEALKLTTFVKNVS